jgi:hypothetical protein
VAVTNAGTEQHTERVGNGTVTLRSDVTGTVNGSPMTLFSIGYQGTDAQDNHWLQFIHREILGIMPDGRAVAQSGSITTTGGTYQLTTGGTATTNGTPKKENYNTDTGPSDPFYEAESASNRTADSTTMFDMPGSAIARVQAASRRITSSTKRKPTSSTISRTHQRTLLL